MLNEWLKLFRPFLPIIFILAPAVMCTVSICYASHLPEWWYWLNCWAIPVGVVGGVIAVFYLD